MILKNSTKIFDTLFAVLLFFIPLSFAIPNITLFLLALIFILDFKSRKTYNSYIIYTLIFVGYIVLKESILSSFFGAFNYDRNYFLIPIIGIISLNVKDVFLARKGFVFGTIVAVIISVINIVLYYFENKTVPLGNSSQIIDLLVIHRPYLGFTCVISVILLFDLIEQSKSKIVNGILIFLLVVFTYLIVARLALLMLLLILIAKFIQKSKLSFTKIVVFVIAVSITVSALFFTNKNVKERFHIKDSFYKTIKVLENQEPRVVIWSCAYKEIISSNKSVFFGKTNKAIQQNLNNCYSKSIKNQSKKEYYLKKEFNTHNQFLDILLKGGIIGLFLFVLLYVKALLSFKRNMNAILLIVSFILFSFLENIFHRQIGVYLFAIFIPLLYNSYNCKKIKKE